MSSKHSPTLQTLPIAAVLLISLGGLAIAQQNVTLDGTSGSESTSGNYSTNGGLNISLGFLAEYLVVAGGGSGGTPGGAAGQNYWGAGGGGAGGMRTDNITLSGTSYGVTVGAGGAAPSYNANSTSRGVNGGNSTFGDITALGGGGGAGGENDGFGGVGAIGGSGGGGGSKYSNTGGNGTSGQGNGGGSARNGDTSSAGSRTAGGGGGGAGAVGGTPASGSSTAGNGGAGLASSISGASVTYAGGGGGGARDTFGGQAAGSGGAGGGGAGSTTSAATSGTDGLGGGGGGAGADGKGGDGGDGIVIVRYKGSAAGTGGTVTSGSGSATGYTLHTFTTTGSSSLNLSSLDMNARLGTTINGTISGTGGLTFNGPGTLNLTGTNTYSGGTIVNAGRLTGNALSIQGDITNNSQLEFNQASSAANFSNISGNGSLTKTGGGDLQLYGNNSYSGGTTISDGRLIGDANTLQGNITNNSQLVFVQTSDDSYDSNISGNGSFTKTGDSKLILAGSNTYTGATSIDQGSLAVNGALGNTSVSVGNANSGYWDLAPDGENLYWVQLSATLQGSGSIGGSVTITSAGGVLSPGNSIESLAMGTLTFEHASTFIQEVDSSATAGIQADLVVVNGNLNIASYHSYLTLTDLFASGSWEDDTKLTMINYSGTWNGGLFTAGEDVLEDDSYFTANGQAWRINYNDLTGGSNYSSEQIFSNFVTLTAIPEPTVVTLSGFGALLLLRRRRA